jgi:hypothetical protein
LVLRWIVAEHGGRCRPSRSRSPREAEPFDVKLDGEYVQIMRRGRLVRTLEGNAADELRRALEAGDGDAVQRIVARRVGIFEARDERE